MSIYSYRRGSIFWSLILIGVGVLFLLQNFNPEVHPWGIIAKFWPVLIIFWGISKLIDYFEAQSRPAIAAPLFSGSEVLILILVLALGTLVSKAVLHPWQGRGMHMGDDPFSNLFTNTYSFTQSFSQPAQGAPHLVLQDQQGDLEIHGSDQTAIDVMAKESIRADDESAAKKLSDKLKIEMADEAGHYVLRSNRNSLDDEGRRISIDQSLRVPTGTSCEIDAQRGDISANDLAGDQTLGTHKGNVHVTNIKGLLKIHSFGGDTQVEGVKGNVELDGRGDDTEITDVSDTVTVRGEFTGTVQIRKVGQTVRYDSMRTQLTAQKLRGSLSMEMGSLDANGIDGPFEVSTRQKDLTINDFNHTLHVTNSDAEVNLQTSSPLTHDIQVESKNGAVELTLPANSNFQIDAKSNHGEVECDFSGPGLKIVKDGDTPSITGVYGTGGPKIRIATEYGSIHIQRAGSQPSTPPHTSPPTSTPPSTPPGTSRTTWNQWKHRIPPFIPAASLK